MVTAPDVYTPITKVSGLDTPSQEQYLRNGFIHVPFLFTPTETLLLRDTFTSQVESHPQFANHDSSYIAPSDILSRYPRFVHPHRHPEVEAGQLARKLLIDNRLISILTNLIGPVYGAQSMFYFKPPTARGQALHQDNLYLQSYPETCIAAWIAIDDGDAENGALIVIPGSHKNDILCLEDSDPEQSFSTSTVKLPKNMPINRVQTEMKAGDVLFFHGSLVHGSLPNTSKERFRRSLIFHYISQSSVEVAKFYQPLIRPDNGEEVEMEVSAGGGKCGETWVEGGH
jgi:phytanoyl-CoA hydroxylase